MTFTPDVDALGRADVTDELTSFVASVPPGSTIDLVPWARYRVDGTWAFDGLRDLTILGHGATIGTAETGDRNRSHIRLTNCQNIRIRGLGINGANPEAGSGGPFIPELAGQHGVEILGSVGIELNRLWVTDTYGDFVYVGRTKVTSSEWISSDWIWIHDSVMVRSGRQGVTLTGARVVGIGPGNVIAEARRSSVDLEPHPGGTGVVAVAVKQNRFYRGRLNWIAAHGSGPVDSVTATGNRLEGMVLSVDVDDRSGGRRKNWRVLDNTSTLNSGNPQAATMKFKRVDGLTVRGNVQPMKPNRGMHLVGVSDCTDVVVDQNELGTNAIGQLKNL